MGRYDGVLPFRVFHPYYCIYLLALPMYVAKTESIPKLAIGESKSANWRWPWSPPKNEKKLIKERKTGDLFVICFDKSLDRSPIEQDQH